MASSRRKQDEKHLKILRELVSKPENRTCFDCHQKGPTYINMTIGSFVCTTCSGILRGLNPPYRVKSISMASFTSEEVEHIKSKGNQYCQAVWLGLYNGKSNIFPETKDEHKIRDFMVNKYEKKRFYVDPVVALKNGEHPPQVKSESSSSASTPSSENKNLGMFHANSFSGVPRHITSVQNASSSPNLNGLQDQSSNIKLSSSVDLLTSVGKSVDDNDPFVSTKSSQLPSECFANFENANIFSTDDKILSCPSPSSVENISTHSEFPPLYPFHNSSHLASPSNPHPDSNILQARSKSSTPSPVPWEGYEEELSAAMPLLPTGELPPTYQPVHKSSSKRNLTDSPVLFAAGVSAQFVTSSIDIKKVAELFELSHEGRAASLPLSLSDSHMKSKRKDGISEFKGGSALAITRSDHQKIKPSFSTQSIEDVFIRDDFYCHEDPLTPAMPLLSIDPVKAERNVEGLTNASPQSSNKYDRHLSLPCGLSPSNEQYKLDCILNEPIGNSSSSLNLKSTSFLPSPKAIRKVFSFHNIMSDANESKTEKKLVPRHQLSAISQKVRARLMSDEDVRGPKNLSSSLPDCSPIPVSDRRSSESKIEAFLRKPKFENVDVLDPITIVYAKQKRSINQSLFFTNRSSSFQNLDCMITQYKEFSACEDSNLNNPDISKNYSMTKNKEKQQSSKSPDSISYGMIQAKALHESLPSLSNLPNNSNSSIPFTNAIELTKKSNGCSISMANLTSLASHFVAGASISKPKPNPYPPFPSDTLTPFSLSTSPSSKPLASSNFAGSASNIDSSSSEDRYAALKDLDEALKSRKKVESSASTNPIFGSSPDGSGPLQTGGVFGTSPVTSGNGFYPATAQASSQSWNATFPAVNPFSGTDPNFNNSQFITSFAPNNASTNGNRSNFGNTSNVQSNFSKLSTNPWDSGSNPNPFNAPPVVPPNGSSYNPFL